jgi:hypothetical protein
MDLSYKHDWEKAKTRLTAWWHCEAVDRCALAVWAPRDDQARFSPPPLPVRVEDRWLDLDYLRARNEYEMNTTFYGGEAFPLWNAGYPGLDLSVYMGASVKLMEETAWIDPIISKGHLEDYDFHNFTIQRENRWFRFLNQIDHFAVEQSRGRAIPSMQDMSSSGDTLAFIRGTEQLLTDMIDCPDYVRQFDYFLMQQMNEQVFEPSYHNICEGAEGSASWDRLWAPGRHYPVQNDFSYMISPRMFRRVFLPTIEMQTEYLDYSVYHVDGVAAYAHVDALCELPRLNALQIIPGEGKPSALHWMDMLKQIQARGKSLQIYIPPDEVELALSELSSRGLWLGVHAESEEQARHLLKMAERWSKDRGKTPNLIK